MPIFFRKTKKSNKVHFLHIGKNAGTAISYKLDEINRDSSVDLQFVKHPHDVVLSDIGSEALYFFGVRHPLERFVSGFYSRKRKGQPRIYNEWDVYEENAFNVFPEANDLAESLFEGGALGQQSIEAMTGIKHVNTMQFRWFGPLQRVFEQHPPVMILRQDCLQKDLALMLNRLGINKQLSLPEDPVRAHKNDYSDIPDLTDKAVSNLKKWYAPDILFFERASA